MNKTILISLVTLSFLTNSYANENKSSAEIMQEALAQMQKVVEETTTVTAEVKAENNASTVVAEVKTENNASTELNASTTIENNTSFTLGQYGTFKFEQANKNVYIMHGPIVGPNKENQGFMNNPALILSDNGLIVIDPGGNYNVGKKILAEIEKVSSKPIIAVINTHKHGDHWFANKAIIEKYPNVDIYAHPHMIKVSKEGEAEVWYGILNRTTGNLAGTKEFAFPTKTLTDGQKIEIDGQKFIIMHPKDAHTDTDILIAHVNSNTLFLADNLMKGRLGSFDESSSILGNISLLEEIKNETDFTLYVPGHGMSGKKEETLDPFLHYLKTLAIEGQKAYDDDKESYEIKAEVLELLKDLKSWDAFERNMPGHLNKVMREIGEAELLAEEEEEEENE
jgi:glyoxylase-like metal-dependent hydrolase (beta-lactamase superfamily II)